MQKVSIVGNAVQPIERKTNPKTEKEFGVLRLAVTTGKDKTTYVDAFVNAGLIDVCEKHVAKGRSLFVRGPVRLRPRKDNSGTVHPNMAVTVDDFELLDEKGGSRGMANGVIIGRLVADPETKTPDSGKSYTRFRVAVEEGRGDNRSTSYVAVVAFGGLSEVAGYLEKGQRVTVVGDVEPRAFERKDDEVGAELSYVASNIVLGAKAGAGKSDEDGQSDSAPVTAGYDDDLDDDIPF